MISIVQNETALKYKIPNFLLILYISIIPVQKIIWLPILHYKVQITEFIFLILLYFSIIFLKNLKDLNAKLLLIDKAILIWFTIISINYISNNNIYTLTELVGQYYLITLYFIIQLIFIQSDSKKIIQLLSKAIYLQAILIILTILLGLILLYFNLNIGVFQRFYSYPYFGNIYRLKALTNEPVMLISILSIPFFFALSNEGKIKQKILKVSIISLIILLAIGKSTPFLVAILILGKEKIKWKNKITCQISKSIACLLIFISIFLSHIIITKNENRQHLGYGQSIPFYKIHSYHLYKSWYFIQKKKPINTFIQNPIMGVGGGNLVHTIATKNKTERKNNERSIAYDPLSTYSGVLSEYGIIGFTGLLFLIFSIYYEWRNSNLNLHSGVKWFFLACFSYFLLEAVCTDILNFRHLWIILGFFSVIIRTNKFANNTLSA